MLVSNPYSYRRRLPHLQKADATIFATFCKLKREPFSPRARDLVLDHCVYEHANRIDLYVAVIMPEHVHLLFRPLRDQDGWPFPLHKILRSIKGISARDINKLMGTSGPVWQDESFDHVVRSEESLLSRADYICMNPVRRGLVRKPEDYKWLWCEPNLWDNVALEP
jgi:REP element-mobilizing transposase RayT